MRRLSLIVGPESEGTQPVREMRPGVGVTCVLGAPVAESVSCLDTKQRCVLDGYFVKILAIWRVPKVLGEVEDQLSLGLVLDLEEELDVGDSRRHVGRFA